MNFAVIDSADLAQKYPGIFPDDRLAVLVRAASGTGDVAAYWQEYCVLSGKRAVNEGEARLWPMVWQRLGEGRAAAPQADKLSAQYRRTALQVTMKMHQAAQVADLLSAQGLEPVFLKGIAMQARAYRGQSLRGMQDVDLYLPPDQVGAAIVTLEAAGWSRAEDRFARVAPERVCDLGANTVLVAAPDQELDLHWSPRPVLEFSASARAQFASDAQTVRHEGRDWPVPGDSWLLFEIVEHGLKQNDVTPVRWLVDGLMLLSADDVAVDWDWLVGFAIDQKLGAHMLLGLRALERISAPVPAEILDRLARHRPCRMERADLNSRLRYLPRWYRGPWRAGLHYGLRADSGWAAFPRYYRQNRMHWNRKRDALRALLGG